MKYRLIECRYEGEPWQKIEVVYEDPDLGVVRFRPRSRYAFRRCSEPIEEISAEVAREESLSGLEPEFRISPVYKYHGPFHPLEPDLLYEMERWPFEDDQ